MVSVSVVPHLSGTTGALGPGVMVGVMEEDSDIPAALRREGDTGECGDQEEEAVQGRTQHIQYKSIARNYIEGEDFLRRWLSSTSVTFRNNLTYLSNAVS